MIFRQDVAKLREALSERLRNGSAVEVGFVKLGEIRAELGAVDGRVNAVADVVGSLFLLTMSPTMFTNLEKIVSGRFGQYAMHDGLRRELTHLRDVGYIAVHSIRDIPLQGDDLSQHITATDAGREFVRLRTSWNPASADVTGAGTI